MSFGSTGGVISAVGAGAVPVSPATIIGDLFSGGTVPAAQQVVFSNGTLLTGAAGLAIIGTPSATAPNTGTNGPGLQTGIQLQGADGVGNSLVTTSFGNGSTLNPGLVGYLCQGIAATPGATTTNDAFRVSMRGHDGTNFTGPRGIAEFVAASPWTPTSQEAYWQVRTTANGSTTIAIACRVDSSQVLVVGGGNNSLGTFTGGTQRPHFQGLGTTQAAVGQAQELFIASALGPTNILAKSRGTTVGTNGLVSANDALGTLSFQGDDGANTVEAANIKVTATGTPASTRVGGNLVISTGTDAAPTVMTAALTINNVQQVAHNSTINATSAATGGAVFSGGAGVAKNLIVGFGVHQGIASTVTAATTTTLTNVSVGTQIFTGSTTQNLQMPAANLFGAGVSVMYTVINRSTGTVTALRAGSDTFNAAATTFACATLTVTEFWSDGVSAWYTK